MTSAPTKAWVYGKAVARGGKLDQHGKLAAGVRRATAILLAGLAAPLAHSAGNLGNASGSVEVTTADTTPVILAAGDIASCASQGDEATAALLDVRRGTVAALGDTAYESGTEQEFASCYEPTWGRHKARTRPAVGNHEYRTPGASGYFDYFGAAAGDRDKGYYSYDLGGWHIVVLNSQCDEVGGCHAGSPQEQWLRADLAAHPVDCTLAYMHHPRFSSGSAHGNHPWLEPLWQALYDAGADVVLAGHDHNYERFAPLTPTGTLDAVHGIRSFVVGTGGRSLRPLGTLKPHSEVFDASAFGILELTLRADGYDWGFVPQAGKNFTDTGSSACHGRPDSAASDFNGDGRSDILWRNASTGENYLYPMDGTTILPGEGYLRTVADLDWKVVGIGDFDGDGRADILWRNSSTGENYIYLMNGTGIAGEGYLRSVANLAWQVAGTGDFDGDGNDDILWRNSASGENYLYPMDGLAIKPTEGYLRTVADLSWRIAGVGDFDGDGRADILWRNSSSGQNYIYPMDGTAIKPSEGYIRTVASQDWQVAGVGDFTGDTRADILWRNGVSGENYLYPMNGTTILGSEGYLRRVADIAWQVKGTGDYDGDGKADVLWRHATSGENYLYPMDGTAIKATEGYLRTVPQPDWQIQYPPLPPRPAAGTVVVLTPVADNTLYESATGDLSNGAGTHFFVGRTLQASQSVRRAVLKFDLASIPAGSTINAATLTLHMSKTIDTAGQSITAHRLLADWGEGTSNAFLDEGSGAPATTNDATWLHRFYSTTRWTNPGGDFVSAASATTTVSGIGSYSWSGAGVAADVRQWLANPATNFGWLLRGNEQTSGTAKRFDSKENSTAAFRPTLTVDFTAPQ